jgi:GNAT superfamily N-acetyltransferase
VTTNAKPGDHLVIRPASAADRAFLDSLNERLIQEAAVPGLTRENLATFQARYTRSALDESPMGSKTLVATDGAGTPLGYIHLEPAPDSLTGKTEGYVSILAVRAESEGRGVAKRLMSEAESWALSEGYRFLLLHVFGSNETARRFYQGGGFLTDSLLLRREIGN